MVGDGGNLTEMDYLTDQAGEIGPTNLAKKLYGIPNERGGITWLDKCPEHLETSSNYSDHALVIRYKEARSGIAKRALNLSSIHIQSPYLKRLLQNVFQNYPGISIDEEEPSFDAPFHPFFHQWAALNSAAERAARDGRHDEVKSLIDAVEEDLGDDMKDAQNLASNGNISFRLVWTLFPPGSPVFGQWKDQDHFFLVHEARYADAEIRPVLILDLLLLDHDGDRYGWRRITKHIQAFSGSMNIAALPAIPLHLLNNCSTVVEKLRARGAYAEKLLTQPPLYKAHEGLMRLHRPFDMEEVQIYVEGRILVDPKGHTRQASRFSPSISTIPYRLECLLSRDTHTKFVTRSDVKQHGAGRTSLLDNLNGHPVLRTGQSRLKALAPQEHIDNSPLAHHRWTEDLLGIPPEVFCRSVVRGYCLTSKAWAEFEVDRLKDIEWNTNAFDALVMQPARKKLIEVLVKQQQIHKADADVDDIVSGKGQGLIMLLTGPPGTGKTLTAESIADRLQLPLYAVGANELGDTAKEIEGRFNEVLRLAGDWNAVLLLDEADAFLEKRIDSPEARDRNKRVAAFLRILEYYKGILILTTNRHVSFDDAFYSRIHLTLPFKALSIASREGIWKNFLRGAEISSDEVLVFAAEDLNGRQIKNVMKMARLLAKDSNEPLRATHVRDVLAIIKGDVEVDG